MNNIEFNLYLLSFAKFKYGSMEKFKAYTCGLLFVTPSVSYYYYKIPTSFTVLRKLREVVVILNL